MSNTKSSGGIGFFGLLTVVFITLKLVGIIEWSWWLVTAPLWGFPVVFLLVAGAAFGLAALLKKW